MAHISFVTVARRASTALNLTVSAQSRSGEVDVRVDGLERPHGFRVAVSAGLSFVYADLKLDSLAMNIVTAVNTCSRDSWRQMANVQGAFEDLGIATEIKLNGKAFFGEDGDLPGNIDSINVSAKSNLNDREPSLVAGDVAAAVIAVLMALLPIDDPANDTDATFQFDTDVEGSKSRREVNFYERSRANRAVAIAIHGTTCKVCDINFGDAYGDLGLGYIEIHHLTPVSQMGAERVVDPSTELIPLCANCHRMTHRLNPPLRPEELKKVMDSSES